MNHILGAALGYLQRGWSVIPVNPDKTPAIKSWKAYHTTRMNPELACKLWSDPNLGIGVVCGQVSGLLVFDVEKAGLDDYPLGTFQTLTARSQGGGLHYYFRWRPGPFHHRFVNDQLVHIADLKADGGYVLAPPTVGKWGVYQWIVEAELAQLPERLLRSSPAPHVDQGDKVGGAPRGSRSERLMAIARRVVEGGGTDDDAYQAMLADPAGSKLAEKRDPLAHVAMLTRLARTTTYPGVSGPTALLRVVGVAESRTPAGRRLTLVMQTADGKTVRQGVTEIPGPRWSAFVAAVPNPVPGVTVKAVLSTDTFNGKQVLRVALWVPA